MSTGPITLTTADLQRHAQRLLERHRADAAGYHATALKHHGEPQAHEQAGLIRVLLDRCYHVSTLELVCYATGDMDAAKAIEADVEATSTLLITQAYEAQIASIPGHPEVMALAMAKVREASS